MSNVTVYSKPACVQCTATYRALNKRGIQFEIIDISQDAEALAHVRSLGHQQAPVVEADGRHWSGFRPDQIAMIQAAA